MKDYKNYVTCDGAKVKERMVFLRARDILGLLDTLVDIGVFAEKEVIR